VITASIIRVLSKEEILANMYSFLEKVKVPQHSLPMETQEGEEV
jgi:hypothetical protein